MIGIAFCHLFHAPGKLLSALAHRVRVAADMGWNRHAFHQNAFHETDTYTSLEKQYRMLRLIKKFYDLGNEAVASYAELDDILNCPAKERMFSTLMDC